MPEGLGWPSCPIEIAIGLTLSSVLFLPSIRRRVGFPACILCHAGIEKFL
ncbi:hypothetical protein ATPR_1581 [Acetobacter tropicalis NBRC 101654]|uniref:Uncharacterized protein n=1 Tax=Acetobacter tropicalis NBRC 101654 TaxID=749388 RepID=F7VDY2_9PROT|nr:hypothetical protein ATPR_1581 [Acetobacter tropicalis NBRC 101654]